MARKPKPSGKRVVAYAGINDGRRLAAQAKRHPRCTGARPGKGDHYVVSSDRGSVVIPQKKLGKGLHATICKQLARIGLVVFVLVPLVGLILNALSQLPQ